jgi:membrane-associated phospholipid phosphatase
MATSPDDLPCTYLPPAGVPPNSNHGRDSATRLPGGTTAVLERTRKSPTMRVMAAPPDSPPAQPRGASGSRVTPPTAEDGDITGVDKRRRQPLRPLLPAWARRPAWILIAGCVILVGVLGVLSAGKAQGNAVDRPIDTWIVRHLGMHWHALFAISHLGSGPGVGALTAVLVLACLAARRLNGAVLAVVSVSVAAALTEYVLKPLVHHTLRGAVSYPSGHTTSLFALTAVVAVLMLGPRGSRPRPVARLLLVLGLVIVDCVVAVAVIGLQWHYFTDTVAGAAVGIGVVLTAAFPLDSTPIRRWLAIGGRSAWR